MLSSRKSENLILSCVLCRSLLAQTERTCEHKVEMSCFFFIYLEPLGSFKRLIWMIAIFESLHKHARFYTFFISLSSRGISISSWRKGSIWSDTIWFRSLGPFYTVNYFVKGAKTSLTCSMYPIEKNICSDSFSHPLIWNYLLKRISCRSKIWYSWWVLRN